MTREDIIKLAQEAGLIRAGEHYTEPARWGISVITHFAKLVAAHEREACANLLLNVDLSPMDADHRLQSWTATVLLNFSAAIRARGEQ